MMMNMRLQRYYHVIIKKIHILDNKIDILILYVFQLLQRREKALKDIEFMNSMTDAMGKRERKMKVDAMGYGYFEEGDGVL